MTAVLPSLLLNSAAALTYCWESHKSWLPWYSYVSTQQCICHHLQWDDSFLDLLSCSFHSLSGSLTNTNCLDALTLIVLSWCVYGVYGTLHPSDTYTNNVFVNVPGLCWDRGSLGPSDWDWEATGPGGWFRAQRRQTGAWLGASLPATVGSCSHVNILSTVWLQVECRRRGGSGLLDWVCLIRQKRFCHCTFLI